MITDDHLRTLRHMLGIDRPELREPKPYRNYYAADPGNEEMKALAKFGAVECYMVTAGGLHYYRCTEAGKALAIASHRKIRWPKSRRVYHRYLEISDMRHDLTFHEFITSPEYAEARKAA